MKHFDKAVLIAVLAFGTHSTLVARNLNGGDCPKTHKLESVNFQFATDDSTFSQLRSCFDFVCRIKQQNHDTTVSD